jgi:predicted phosphodiesterase
MRYAIISDIHANLDALEAVLRDLDDVGPIDEIWCLGDLVANGPQPNECVARIGETAAGCIQGNVDAMLLGLLPVPEHIPPEVKAAITWTVDALTQPSRDFLAALPPRLEVGSARHCTLVHNAPLDEYGHPRRPGQGQDPQGILTTVQVASANFAALPTRHCFVGHTHRPVLFRQEIPPAGRTAGGHAGCQLIEPMEGGVYPLAGHRAIANPGSVGLPRDGNWMASYAILEEGQNGQADALTFRRVAYDLASLEMRLRAIDHPAMTAAVKDALVYAFGHGRPFPGPSPTG